MQAEPPALDLPEFVLALALALELLPEVNAKRGGLSLVTDSPPFLTFKMGKHNKSTAPKNYTLEQVLEAVRDSYGIVSRVAERLNCDWLTADKYIKIHEGAKEAMAAETERVLDVAETKIIKALNMDDIGTAKWLLSTKGKHRGYNERFEHTGKDGADLQAKTVVILRHGDKFEEDTA